MKIFPISLERSQIWFVRFSGVAEEQAVIRRYGRDGFFLLDFMIEFWSKIAERSHYRLNEENRMMELIYKSEKCV